MFTVYCRCDVQKKHVHALKFFAGWYFCNLFQWDSRDCPCCTATPCQVCELDMKNPWGKELAHLWHDVTTFILSIPVPTALCLPMMKAAEDDALRTLLARWYHVKDVRDSQITQNKDCQSLSHSDIPWCWLVHIYCYLLILSQHEFSFKMLSVLFRMGKPTELPYLARLALLLSHWVRWVIPSPASLPEEPIATTFVIKVFTTT